MLGWALLFVVIALVCSMLGFTILAGVAATVAKIIFFVFLALFAAALLMHFMRGSTDTSYEGDAVEHD